MKLKFKNFILFRKIKKSEGDYPVKACKGFFSSSPTLYCSLIQIMYYIVIRKWEIKHYITSCCFHFIAEGKRRQEFYESRGMAVVKPQGNYGTC